MNSSNQEGLGMIPEWITSIIVKACALVLVEVYLHYLRR